MPVPHPTPRTGTVTTDLELRERISKSKEILVNHGFAMSAVPEIAKTFNVSLRTAYRYKAEAEKELHADIDMSDREAARLLLDGLLDIFHSSGVKAGAKLRALDMIAKLKGLYRPQKIEVSTPLKDLADDDLKAMVEQLGIIPASDPAQQGPSPAPATA
jgi:hypothetical protein